MPDHSPLTDLFTVLGPRTHSLLAALAAQEQCITATEAYRLELLAIFQVGASAGSKGSLVAPWPGAGDGGDMHELGA